MKDDFMDGVLQQLYGWDGHNADVLAHRNSGNLLRTSTVCQPRGLLPGDILATGEVVLDPPWRENGLRLEIHIRDRYREDFWLDVAPRLPLALITPTIMAERILAGLTEHD